MQRTMMMVAFALLVCGYVVVASPPARAAQGWNYETLDSPASTGWGLATAYYPLYEQHHVFTSGNKDGLPTLRHGWFQPGYSSWKFEWLDTTTQTCCQIATVVTGNVHHVFFPSTLSDTLRHGAFDPTVGTWFFETLDPSVSQGYGLSSINYGGSLHIFGEGKDSSLGCPSKSLRHGVLGPSGWSFETLDLLGVEGFGCYAQGSDGGVTVASIGGANLNVFSSGGFGGEATYSRRSATRHGWLDASGWHFETFPSDVGSAIQAPDGRLNTFGGGCDSACLDPPPMTHGWYDGEWHFEPFLEGCCPCTATFNGHLEVFAFHAFPGYPVHAWWDGESWNWESLDAGIGLGGCSAIYYPTFNQLHTFWPGQVNGAGC